MKKTFKLVAVLCITSIFAISCSSDDPSGPTDATANYKPLAIGNYWNYTVEASTGITTDSLYIARMASANGFDYFDFDATATSTGLMTNMYSANIHRKVDNAYLVYGSLDLGAILDNAIDFTIELNDEVLLHETAAVGTVLGSISNSFTQDIQNIPLTIDYTLTNTINNKTANIVVNGVTFEDIIETRIALNMSITAVVDVAGFPLTVTVMQPQNVLVMENSYANNIGLVQSDSDVSYQLEDIPGFTYPFPQSNSESVSQKINRYNVDN